MDIISEVVHKKDALCEESSDVIVFSMKNPSEIWFRLSLKCFHPQKEDYEVVHRATLPGEVAEFKLNKDFTYILTVFSLKKERYFKVELENLENSDSRKFILRPIGMYGEVLEDKKLSVRIFKGNKVIIG